MNILKKIINYERKRKKIKRHEKELAYEEIFNEQAEYFELTEEEIAYCKDNDITPEEYMNETIGKM